MGKVCILIYDDPENELTDKILELVGEPHEQILLTHQSLVMKFEGMEIRLLEKSVSIDGQEVSLSKAEFSVLRYLARHPGWVQSKQQIFDEVWPLESNADYHTVEVAIYSLRKKIDPDISHPRFICTVPGHGYRFIGKKIT